MQVDEPPLPEQLEALWPRTDSPGQPHHPLIAFRMAPVEPLA